MELEVSSLSSFPLNEPVEDGVVRIPKGGMPRAGPSVKRNGRLTPFFSSRRSSDTLPTPALDLRARTAFDVDFEGTQGADLPSKSRQNRSRNSSRSLFFLSSPPSSSPPLWACPACERRKVGRNKRSLPSSGVAASLNWVVVACSFSSHLDEEGAARSCGERGSTARPPK
jgi:hypothetical protein